MKFKYKHCFALLEPYEPMCILRPLKQFIGYLVRVRSLISISHRRLSPVCKVCIHCRKDFENVLNVPSPRPDWR